MLMIQSLLIYEKFKQNNVYIMLQKYGIPLERQLLKATSP